MNWLELIKFISKPEVFSQIVLFLLSAGFGAYSAFNKFKAGLNAKKAGLDAKKAQKAVIQLEGQAGQIDDNTDRLKRLEETNFKTVDAMDAIRQELSQEKVLSAKIIQAIENKLDDATELLISLQEELRETKTCLDETIAKLHDAETRLAKTTADLAETQAQLDRAQTQLAATLAINEEQATELDRLRSVRYLKRNTTGTLNPLIGQAGDSADNITPKPSRKNKQD